MKFSVRYLILAALVLGIFTALFFLDLGALIYSLEQDSFYSRYHDNTDVLRAQQLNSTTDLLPLMQDLLDFSGPIILNINLRDMDQVRRDLALFAKYHKNLDNLIIRLDMTQSEIEEFSKDSDLQRLLLEELMKASISLDELQQLEIQYRAENNQNMLMSVILQQEAIRQKLKELYGEYDAVTEKIDAISKKYNLDTTKNEESRGILGYVEETTKSATAIVPGLVTQPPSMSLLLKPDTGTYLDVIELSAFYSSGSARQTPHPITIFVDNDPIIQSSTDANGAYHGSFVIGMIPAGMHTVNATSGTTGSAPRILNVIKVPSTTTLMAKAVSNKPIVQCSGMVTANKPVQNAPVTIITDSRGSISTITNSAGQFLSQITLSAPRLEARFDNDTFPISSSRSPVYEIVIESSFEAPEGKVKSITPVTIVQHVDAIRLTLAPTNVMYKDTINITGTLTGKDPASRYVDIFVDNALYRTVQTRPDGTYHDTFVVGKIPAGVHTVFSRYRELGVDELYSESRTFRVTPVGTTTTIHVEMIDGGTGVICTGNITAQGRGISGAPLELVWDDTHVITIQTDAAGTYRQQVTLPVGTHRTYANFSAQDYPVTPSRSTTVTVTIPPPIDLYVRPSSVQYMDQLTIGGALRGANTSAKEIQVFIDGRKLGTYRTDAKGNYSTTFSVETIPAGTHRVYASSGAHTSGTEAFTVVPVNASVMLSARLSADGTQVVCSGQVRVGENLPVRSAPVTIAWGGTNTTTTTTDQRGEFEETLSLPAGGYELVAEFDKTDLYPIKPARSAVVYIQVPNPITVQVLPDSGKYRDTLTITVQPDHGRYRDTLLVNGSLHADQIAYQEIRLFVDDRLAGTYRTDAKGAFTIPYTIEKITGGRHTLKAVRGAITSTPIPIVVLMDTTMTTLSAERTGSTAEVTISGRVNTTNRTVRDAPVTITWDGTHFLETRTDGNGVFRDSIILPAGTHRIQARFNRTDLYPLHPSNSTTVVINISPGLSLDVQPSLGIYKDPISLQGTLVRPGTLEGTVDLFLDNQQIATTPTDRAGHYTHTLVIEQLPAGSHTVQAKTGDLTSGVRTFTILPAHSRTTLTVIPVNTSTLYACNGTVMAFNRAGDVIRRPGNIRDVIALLPTLGRDLWSAATRPVSDAPVALIVNNERLLEMQTDEYGRFSCVVALPPGDNRISARFDATGFPLYSSQAKEHSVNIPSANMTPFVEEESSPVTAFVPVLVIAAILLLFTGGAVFYLKRRSLHFMTRRSPSETSAEDEARASAAEIEQEIVAAESYLAAVSPPEPAQVATDPLLARYIRILNAQGLSTAARAVYVHFTGSIAERLHIRRHRTLTPREFLGQCDKRPFTDTFSVFIAVYEQVRYGGIKTPAKENEFEESVKKTDESLGGDKD